MKHRVTAIRMDETKHGIEISGLTQSPRGTKTRVGSVKLGKPSKDRAKRAKDFQSAIEELLGKNE